MIVETHRFGAVELAEEDVIRFPEGLVGLCRLKQFVLLRDPTSSELFWLQSLDEPAFALACVHQSKLEGQFELDLATADATGLKLESPDDAEVFLILNRVHGDFTVNLKGPVLVNVGRMIGKQVILADSRYEARHTLRNAQQPALTA